jgi:hypothetical protein
MNESTAASPVASRTGAESTPQPTAAPPGHHGLGLALILVASFMVVLDFSIVNGWLPGTRSPSAPAASSLITTGFAEGPARTRALGMYGATASGGCVSGLVLGGVLVEFFTWRTRIDSEPPAADLTIADGRSQQRRQDCSQLVGKLAVRRNDISPPKRQSCS